MSPDHAVALCVFAALGVAVLGSMLTRRHVRRVSRALSFGLDFPPIRLTLDPTPAETLPHPDEAASLLTELEQLGFRRAGVFTLRQLPGLVLVGLEHTEQPVLAALVDHPSAGLSLDLLATSSQDELVCATNSPQHGPFVDPPFKPTLRREGASPSELWQLIHEEAAARDLVFTPMGPFATAFPRQHAREVDWRCVRGGPTEAELQEAARRTGSPLDEAQLSHARTQLLRSANQGLWHMCQEAAEARWPTALADPEHQLFGIVFDRMTQDEVVDLVLDWLRPLPDELAALDAVQGHSAREDFARVLTTLRPGARKLGSLEEPVEADVWISQPLDEG